jgi:hypothetical protein
LVVAGIPVAEEAIVSVGRGSVFGYRQDLSSGASKMTEL